MGLSTRFGSDELAFSPDGRLVAAAGDKQILVWSASTGVKVRELRGDWRQVPSLQFSPDGKYLLASVENGAVLLNWKTDAEGRRFDGHMDTVMCAVFSPEAIHPDRES